jgi:hypothetical protein
MPVNVAQTIDARLWAILFNGQESASAFKLGNLIKSATGTEIGWKRERSRIGYGGDFPWLDIIVGEEFSDSAFRKDESYDMRRQGFLQTGMPWESDQNESVRIIIVDNKMDLAASLALRQKVCRDIKRADVQLGLPDLVMGYGPFTGGSRFIITGETSPGGAPLQPGTIATIRFTVETTQDGYDSLGM